MSEIAVQLKTGREKSVLRGHPWIFSGAVARVDGEPLPGATATIYNSAGERIALGAYSPDSSIRVRIWSRSGETSISRDFFRARIRAAVDARKQLDLPGAGSNACRLVYAESDGLPGLIADRYNRTLVVQFLSAGAERWRNEISEELAAAAGLENVYERSDAKVRRLEGLPLRTGVVLGADADAPLEILEDGLRYLVDIKRGHKTGFYLDQRFNRARVRDLARGKEVLNAFAYTGGFAVAALAGGAANVVSIESSQDSIELGQENLALNGYQGPEHSWVRGNVFFELRTLRDAARSFDLIVLDPPKFAATRRQAEAAARGYKDINLLAFKLLRPGGLLVSFSCSGGIDAELFQKIVAGAALDAGVESQIIERLEQGPDHPVALHFPESRYLKGLVMRRKD